MLPLCRHFSRLRHSSSQPPFQAAHPWLQGMGRGRSSSSGQHLRWVSNSTPEHSTGTVCPHSYSLSTPRDPPSLSNNGQIRPWICVDPSGWETGSRLVQIRGAPERGELLTASPRPGISSPHLLINQGWGQTPPFAASRAGDQHPESPPATQVAEVFPHQPLEVSSRQHWGSALAAAAGK